MKENCDDDRELSCQSDCIFISTHLLFLASTELLWPLLAVLASERMLMPPTPLPMSLSQLLLSSATAEFLVLSSAVTLFGFELPLTIFCLLDGGGGGVLPLLPVKIRYVRQCQDDNVLLNKNIYKI